MATNATEERVVKSGAKQIHYLSMQFLIGRLLANNLRNLGIYDTCAEVAADMGANLPDVLETGMRSRTRKRWPGLCIESEEVDAATAVADHGLSAFGRRCIA